MGSLSLARPGAEEELLSWPPSHGPPGGAADIRRENSRRTVSDLASRKSSHNSRLPPYGSRDPCNSRTPVKKNEIWYDTNITEPVKTCGLMSSSSHTAGYNTVHKSAVCSF